MNARRIALAAAFAALLLVPPTLASKRLASAMDRARAEETMLIAAQRDAQEIIRLRAERQRIAVRKRPQEHVLAQVNAVLAEAGIPARKLQGVRPEADQALPGARSGGIEANYRRQSASINLQQIEVAELGRFLALWRRADSLWTPARIEINKHRGRGGEDELYDVTLVISAVYIAD